MSTIWAAEPERARYDCHVSQSYVDEGAGRFTKRADLTTYSKDFVIDISGFVSAFWINGWRTILLHMMTTLTTFLMPLVSRCTELDHPSCASVENEIWRDLAFIEQMWIQQLHLVSRRLVIVELRRFTALHDSETHYLPQHTGSQPVPMRARESGFVGIGFCWGFVTTLRAPGRFSKCSREHPQCANSLKVLC